MEKIIKILKKNKVNVSARFDFKTKKYTDLSFEDENLFYYIEKDDNEKGIYICETFNKFNESEEIYRFTYNDLIKYIKIDTLIKGEFNECIANHPDAPF